MALRERKDCTEEGLVPRALAIQSSDLPSSTQRRMSSVNFLSEILWFIPTHAPYFWLRTQENLLHPRCEAGRGASARRPIFRELRLYGVLGSSDLDGLGSEVRCGVFGLCFGHGRTRLSGSDVTSDSWSASPCQ